MKITNQELAIFCKQLALIQSYGISLYEGFSLLVEDAKNKETKAVLTAICQELEQGKSLYEALSSISLFPDYMLKMIYIGEISGRQDEVLTSLATYYQRFYDLHESIKSAIRYPCIMIVLMCVVIMMIFTTILPIFQQVFNQLGKELTGFSKTMVTFGTICSHYMYVLVMLFIGIILLYIFVTKTKFGKSKQQKIVAFLPITKSLSIKIATSKFASGVAVALSSGLDIEESVEMASSLVEHPLVTKKLEICKQVLKEEHDFSKALKQSQLFLGIYAQLLTVSIKTGHIDTIFKEVASRFDEEINEKIIHIVNIIEPTLVIVLSLIVGIVLVSIMLPLIGIMANL